MIANLFRRQLERNGVFLLVAALMLGGFQFTLCAIVASVDVQGAFSQMTQFAPPLFRTMIEQNLMGGSPGAVLAFGWNHPVAHALLSAIAITLAARAVAGEVENGMIELLLAQPLSRRRYFAAQVLFAACAIAGVLAVGVVATAAGQVVFSLQAFGSRLAPLFVNMLLLQLSIYALTLCASAFGREAGRAAIAGVLVALLSFLINAIATLWTRAEFAKPYSLHSYFDPRLILVKDDLAATSVAVLAAVTLIATALAYLRFARRDLP